MRVDEDGPDQSDKMIPHAMRSKHHGQSAGENVECADKSHRSPRENAGRDGPLFPILPIEGRIGKVIHCGASNVEQADT